MKYSVLVVGLWLGACGSDMGKTLDAPAAIDSGIWDASLIDASGEDAPSQVNYFGNIVAGGMDRMFLWKADSSRDLCVGIFLASPGLPNPGYDISVSAPWYFEVGPVAPVAAICGGPQPPASVPAITVTGTVTFTGMASGYPCTANVDAVLTFEQTAPWVPATDTFVASIPVNPNC